MEFEPGDRVTLPDGGIGEILGHTVEGLVRVRLEGLREGHYEPERLTPHEEKEQ